MAFASTYLYQEIQDTMKQSPHFTAEKGNKVKVVVEHCSWSACFVACACTYSDPGDPIHNKPVVSLYQCEKKDSDIRYCADSY